MHKSVCLLDLKPRHLATVRQLRAPVDSMLEPGLLHRLGELGFLPGEALTVLRRGPGGREPIAVQIGDSIFALRAIEAGCIHVDLDALSSQHPAESGARV